MVRSKWLGFAFAVIALALPATPSLAYEEDTHFGLTYVICRSVGFTQNEALTVAAADQGVDDSDGTSPVGSGINAVAERYVANQWMWHAIGRSYRVIFDQRDRMFALAQDTWLSGNQKERLILLGIFFHYQQDTWAHRRHYAGSNLIPGSRVSYIPYASPFGHFMTPDNATSSPSDYHQPDRPPFDPAAALMDLEDGIGYASTFLKNVLHRTPYAIFNDYIPGNCVVDNGAQTSPYVHQIRVDATDPAHRYLQELIHAQIAAYTYSNPPDDGDYPLESVDQSRRWSKQYVSNLGDLGKVMQQYRAVCSKYKQYFNNEELLLSLVGGDSTQSWHTVKEQTPFTDGKTCKDYTRPYLEAMMGGWQDVIGYDVKPSTDLQGITGPWTLASKPDGPSSPPTRIVSVFVKSNGAILGIGENRLVYGKNSLEDDWKQLQNVNLPAGNEPVMRYKTMLSVSQGVLMIKRPPETNWKRAPYSNAFTGPTGTCSLISVAVLPDGRLLGVNDAHQLLIKGRSPWQPQKGYLTTITVAPDGTVWGANEKIPSGNNVFHLVNGAWQGAAIRLTYMSAAPNGNIWGTDATGALMRLNRGSSQWESRPGKQTAFGFDASGLGNMWGVDATQPNTGAYPDNITFWGNIDLPGVTTKSRWAGPMYLTDIAVGPDGNPWGVNAKLASGNNVFQLYGMQWRPSPARLTHIAIAPNKTVWGVTENGSVQRLAPGSNEWEDVPGIRLTTLANGPDGRVWGADKNSTDQHNIYFLVP